jgi:uncharacterized protein (TIGR02757 family)
MKTPALRTHLDDLYARFHSRRLLGTDPLLIVHRFADPADQEIVGLLAACLAYGNVKAIMGGIENLLARMGPSPRRFLADSSPAQIRSAMRRFRYRVTDDQAIARLLIGVSASLHRHGSLKAAFNHGDDPSDATIVPALGRFVDEIAGPDRLGHLLPHPDHQSACKRLMLYLRWMVRRDEIDLGLWTGIDAARLVIPLDTHMHRVALELGLTKRRTATLVTAMDITKSLRRIAPADPLRYDFALTRPGIMRVA